MASLPPSMKYPLYFLYAFLAIAAGEELFFRGFLQRRLEEKMGKRKGILTATAIFLLPHAAFYRYWPADVCTIYLLLVANLGLILGIIFSETRNLIATWIAHGTLVFTMGVIVGLF